MIWQWICWKNNDPTDPTTTRILCPTKESMSLQEFDIFWEAYPMKKGKTDAERHWQRIKPTLSEVMAALEIQKQEKIWLEQNKLFVSEWKHGSTWVNQQCWRDGYHPDFEKYLKWKLLKPERERREREKRMYKIRDDYQEYLESKSTAALLDIKRDGGNLWHSCGWLLDEILASRQLNALKEKCK